MGKLPPTIVFESIADKKVGQDSFPLEASGGDSGMPITFTISTQPSMGVAYGVSLSSTSVLSLGIQGGYFQRNTEGRFTTDDQFVNGSFDPNVNSNDAILNESTSYPSFSGDCITRSRMNPDWKKTLSVPLFST